ncbi:MAG: lipoyl synthase [Alphaproteobacteria bacterium]|nr:lipoyl synthase [Alphaproteobacteria bacterium]
MTRRRPAHPPWLKARMPGGERYTQIKARARTLKLHTVCEEARCPNVGECWGGGTATFMVMGGICTRGCRFCAVTTRRNGMPLDPDEPANLAEAIAEMGLDYVVVTSVDRDDLPDQGAGHFAACIQATRQRSPGTMIEVLVPDFRGARDLVKVLVDAAPEVLAHNVETVERLTPTVRDPRAGYRQSLAVLRAMKELNPDQLTKSSLMVGLGETRDEMIEAMADLVEVGCDFLTIGQYLRPTSRDQHLPVIEYIEPAQFAEYERLGRQMGFKYVASGPLVRSSYKAGEFFIQQYLRERQAAAAPAVQEQSP